MLGGIFSADRFIQFPGLSERLDSLGYIPVVGTVSGACRIICGIAQTVLAGIAAPAKICIEATPGDYWIPFADGLYQMARGAVELVPIIGGLCTACFDIYARTIRKLG